jgi:serine/threonine-protein kinase
MRVTLPPTDLSSMEPGTTFHDRYRVVRCIKSGGMGTVYEVVDERTKRSRALKTMLPHVVLDSDLRRRFADEATVTASITSEHIVQVLDAGVDDPSGLPFLVMELLVGEDLGTRLERCGRLSATETTILLYQLTLALERTHDAGIVHRDLKPENLFVTAYDDGSPHLKVLDFGIAKVIAESGKAKTTRNVGTPLYMSPEQVRGDGRINGRADLYSVGHIAFALLTGHAYFEPEETRLSSAEGLLLSIVTGAPEPASVRAAAYGVTLPPGFDAWYARATAVRVEDRFATARDMLAALVVALGTALPRNSSPSMPAAVFTKTLPSEPPQIGTVTEQSPTQPVAIAQDQPKRQHWMPLLMLLVVALVVIPISAVWLHRSDRPTVSTTTAPPGPAESAEPAKVAPAPNGAPAPGEPRARPPGAATSSMKSTEDRAAIAPLPARGVKPSAKPDRQSRMRPIANGPLDPTDKYR